MAITGKKPSEWSTATKDAVRTSIDSPKAEEITVIKQLTAAEYAALETKVSTTLYIIVG